MRVLAIDPGYGRCGMAVLERIGSKDAVLFSTCVETSKEQDFSDRLHAVITECERLLRDYKPVVLAMEKLYFQKNRTTAMRVAEVRGAILHAAARESLEVHEYTPGEVKSAAAGWGGADKKQIASMLHALIRIEKSIVHDDEYDAIAIGVTHLARCRPALARVQ